MSGLVRGFGQAAFGQGLTWQGTVSALGAHGVAVARVNGGAVQGR